MANKLRGFAGFLDGYKARNIATSVPVVEFQFEEIKKSALAVTESQRNKDAPKEIIDLLERLVKTFNLSQEKLLETGITCGETIKTILLISKSNNDPSGLIYEEKMKRLVFHYLEFAELIEDKTISDLAITIGELF